MIRRMKESNLPPYRRIVTGHSPEGRAVIRSDGSFQTEVIASGDAAFSLVWTAPRLPVDNDDPVDGRERDVGLTLNSGTVIRIVDMLPGGTSPMHRTNSLDYGIVLSGEVELELDDGVKTLAGPGTIIIQRGTIHRWTNPSRTTPCRIVFALVEAHPVRINGRPLAEMKPEDVHD